MSQAINGIPSLNLKTTPATSSGKVSGTAETDPNSFQLLVNWFMNQNINNLAKIGNSTDDSDSSSDNDSSFFNSFGLSGYGSSSSSDPFSAMGANLFKNTLPGISTSGPFASAESLAYSNPLLELQRLGSFNNYANLVNPKEPKAASYTDPETGKAAVGIIEEVQVAKNGDVTLVINGNNIPLSAVKGITSYDEDSTEA
jgi:hypothetical protein